MSVIFTEGFDDGLSSRKWFDPPQLSTVFARTGLRSGLWGQDSGDNWDLVLPSTPVTFTHGMAVLLDNPRVLDCLMWQYADRNYVVHASVKHNWVEERLYIEDANGAEVLSTPFGAIRRYVWNFLELQITIDNAAGSVGMQLNDIPIGTAAGIDTLGGGGLAECAVIYGRETGSWVGEAHIDDVYVTDTAGVAPYNGFLGDVAVRTLFPNGNGTYSEQTGSDGNQINNFELVDENPNPDGDTTYVESPTDGHRDTYNFQDLPTAAFGPRDIRGVNVHMYSRKEVGPPKSIRNLIRTAALDFNGADLPLQAAYDIKTERWDQNPNTVADWTEAEVNALEAGQEVRP